LAEGRTAPGAGVTVRDVLADEDVAEVCELVEVNPELDRDNEAELLSLEVNVSLLCAARGTAVCVEVEEWEDEDGVGEELREGMGVDSEEVYSGAVLLDGGRIGETLRTAIDCA